jgi:CubicO group peptidase (beta-lactamase class C family)
MHRRTFLIASGAMMTSLQPAYAQDQRWNKAAAILQTACQAGQVRAAAIWVQQESTTWTQSFGDAPSPDASFLLGSITKPIVIAAVMTLVDAKKLDLQEPVRKYLPEFHGDGREGVLVRHLLTHVSGLPDQLPENASLRASHAPLADFVKGAMKVPLAFPPGTRYEYSSMAILLASELAQRLSGIEIKEFVTKKVIEPLGMTRSSLGIVPLARKDLLPCQVEFGAVEAGGGSPDSKSWDWNSDYWRALGAPWGGGHASAADIGRFLESFRQRTDDRILSPEVAKEMIRNQNPANIKPRGFGFDVQLQEGCPHASPAVFGHTGSTGTIAWMDPTRDRTCVVLTTLPARATRQHPRTQASEAVDAA